jgi:hypothetical protein
MNEVPVIGLQITEDGSLSSTLKFRYFDLTSKAIFYYKENHISKYYLMINPSKDEKKVFNQIYGLKESGTITKSFLAKPHGENASDQAINYIEKDLGLTRLCGSKATGESKKNICTNLVKNNN